MSRILVTALAQDDLEEIWSYVARRSPRAADRLAADLARNFQTLGAFPGLGQSSEELLPNSRASSVGNFVVYYRPIDGGIEVLRVVHGARDVTNLVDPDVN